MSGQSGYSPSQLQPRQVIGVALGYFALFFASQSVMVLAQPYYQMTLAVDPLLLAMSVTIPMLLGTLFSPWLGAFSDQFRSRFGRRRPFLLVGSLICAGSFALIWQVSPTWPASWQAIYFAGLCLCFFLAIPLMAVPLSSLVFEQSPDLQQRTWLFGVTSAVQKIGALGYQWLVPISQMAMFGNFINGVRSVGLIVATFCIAMPGLFAVLLCKEKNQPTVPSIRTPPRFRDSFRLLQQSGPLRLILAICLLQLGGVAWFAGIDYYVLVYFMFAGDLTAGSWWKAVLSSSYALVGLLLVPLLAKISQSMGIWRLLVGIFILNALGGLAKWLLYTPDIGYWLLVDALLCSPAWTAMVMLIPPLLAQCSQPSHGEESNSNALGEVSGLYYWVASGSGAFAMLLAGATLNWSGFSAELGAAQSEHALWQLRTALAGGTFLCSFGILLLLARLRRYPSFRSQVDGNY